MIALTKLDTVGAELAEALAAELAEASGARVIPVSGITGEGVETVLDALIERIGKVAGKTSAEDEPGWSPL